MSKLPSQRALLYGAQGAGPSHMSQSMPGGTGSAGRLHGCESGPTLTLIDLIVPSSPPQHLLTISAIVFQHPLAAAGDHAAVAPGGRDHQRAFAERPRLGLLAVNVLAAAGRPRSR